jgi:hypothetical protein
MFVTRLMIGLALLVGALNAHAGAVVVADLGVMSFQAWKTSRVEEARNILERLQSDAQLDKAPAVDRSPFDNNKKKSEKKDSARSIKSVRADQRVQQAQLNLEISQEFAVNDYFLLYLNQFKNRDSFLEAAKKLTPEEAADLMMAYQKHLTSNADTSDIPSTLPVKSRPTSATQKTAGNP